MATNEDGAVIAGSLVGFMIPLVGFIIAAIRLGNGKPGGVPIAVFSLAGLVMYVALFG